MSDTPIEKLVDYEAKQIIVAFLPRTDKEAAPEESCGPCGLLSWIVGAYFSTLQFSHCEIALSLKPGLKVAERSAAAIGINDTERSSEVYFKLRTFHAGYQWRYVRCTADELRAIVRFGRLQVGRPFCKSKMASVAFCPGSDVRDAYYCAHLTMACLELIANPVFHLNSPNKMTVDDIATILGQLAKEDTNPTRLVPVQEKTAYKAVESFLRKPNEIKI